MSLFNRGWISRDAIPARTLCYLIGNRPLQNAFARRNWPQRLSRFRWPCCFQSGRLTGGCCPLFYQIRWPSCCAARATLSRQE